VDGGGCALIVTGQPDPPDPIERTRLDEYTAASGEQELPKLRMPRSPLTPSVMSVLHGVV
jgi:hypothetical protein